MSNHIDFSECYVIMLAIPFVWSTVCGLDAFCCNAVRTDVILWWMDSLVLQKTHVESFYFVSAWKDAKPWTVLSFSLAFLSSLPLAICFLHFCNSQSVLCHISTAVVNNCAKHKVLYIVVHGFNKVLMQITCINNIL